VRTNPEKTWKDLVQQRVRWASKTTAYSHVFGKSVGFLVFAANACLLLLAAGSIGGYIPWSFTGILFLVKCNIDFFLLYRTALFFDQTESLRSYLPSSFLYPLFSVWVAMLSFKGSYQWKGRSYKKSS
jgi:cellulose synthase/poly-beta-1,6-N-acetylglucosamine synthase-like glycosyltransferase